MYNNLYQGLQVQFQVRNLALSVNHFGHRGHREHFSAARLQVKLSRYQKNAVSTPTVAITYPDLSIFINSPAGFFPMQKIYLGFFDTIRLKGYDQL